jgi:hypothetical protein
MDIILLGITVVALVVAFVTSVALWRLTREEKQRAAARVAVLSAAAGGAGDAEPAPVGAGWAAPVRAAAPVKAAPWGRVSTSGGASIPIAPPVPLAPSPSREPELALNREARVTEDRSQEITATGFLGTVSTPRTGGGQRTLAIAAAALFVLLAGGLAWMISAPRGTSAAAMGPNHPLELISLRHERQKDKLAVSGLVRNPPTGQFVEGLSAVVFLFDRQGAFVTSARAQVDFLKLGVGDETPFVVSLAAPPTVSRYRVSFRTDDGVVPHIDRRGSAPLAADGEQPVGVTVK